jgi:hypothetical protein
MLKNLNEWFRRSKFPSSANAPLAWGSEYWDAEPKSYEGWEEIKRIITGPSPNWEDPDMAEERINKSLAFRLSWQLLDEVIVAAGGIEYSANAFKDSISELQDYCDKYKIVALTDVQTGVFHQSATTAWYEFTNVLFWSRTLEERLERKPSSPREGLRKQGLLPALTEGSLKTEVQRLIRRLRSGPVGEARKLTNFSLHIALVKHPFSGANVDEKGKVHMLIPGMPINKVANWNLLDWTQQRDGVNFIEGVVNSTEEFMDELLTAFEKTAPDRYKNLEMGKEK